MGSTEENEKDCPFFDEPELYDDDDDDDFEDADEFTDEGFDNDNTTTTLNPNPNPNPNVPFSPPTLPQNGSIQSLQDRRISPFDDSRRLFQRLWTDEDEIVILEGFLDFVTQRGTTHANYQHDTGPFYEQIKNKIQLDFNKNQLIEKLRRLKKKFRNVDSRMKSKGLEFAFRSPHEKVTYEISQKIWSSTFKRPRNKRYRAKRFNLDADDEQQPKLIAVEIGDPKLAIPSVVEETMKCCLSPLFKELLQYGIGGPNGGLMLNSLPLSLNDGLGSLPKGLEGEMWRNQQILELEVYLKRVELLEEHIKATLEELRSSATTKTMKVES